MRLPRARQGQRGRRHRPRREHARRQRAAPGRYRHLDVGPDHRDHQHRCRRPARSRRCALVRGQEIQAEIHGRSRDAHRRDHGRARHGACGPVLQQRRAVGAADQGRAGDRRARLAHAARPGLRQADRFEVRRHEEHRRPLRRLDHRRAVPAALRRRHALGASRYRRHRHGRAVDATSITSLGHGLRRAAARPAGGGPLRSRRTEAA